MGMSRCRWIRHVCPMNPLKKHSGRVIGSGASVLPTQAVIDGEVGWPSSCPAGTRDSRAAESLRPASSTLRRRPRLCADSCTGPRSSESPGSCRSEVDTCNRLRSAFDVVISERDVVDEAGHRVEDEPSVRESDEGLFSSVRSTRPGLEDMGAFTTRRCWHLHAGVVDFTGMKKASKTEPVRESIPVSENGRFWLESGAFIRAWPVLARE